MALKCWEDGRTRGRAEAKERSKVSKHKKKLKLEKQEQKIQETARDSSGNRNVKQQKNNVGNNSETEM